MNTNGVLNADNGVGRIDNSLRVRNKQLALLFVGKSDGCAESLQVRLVEVHEFRMIDSIGYFTTVQIVASSTIARRLVAEGVGILGSPTDAVQCFGGEIPVGIDNGSWFRQGFIGILGSDILVLEVLLHGKEQLKRCVARAGAGDSVARGGIHIAVEGVADSVVVARIGIEAVPLLPVPVEAIIPCGRVGGEPFGVCTDTILEHGKCIAVEACAVQGFGKAQPYGALAVNHGIGLAEDATGVLLGDHLAIEEVVANPEVPLRTVVIINPRTAGITHTGDYLDGVRSVRDIAVALAVGTSVNLELLAVAEGLVATAGDELTLVVAGQADAGTGTLAAGGTHLSLEAEQTADVGQHLTFELTFIAGNTGDGFLIPGYSTRLSERIGVRPKGNNIGIGKTIIAVERIVALVVEQTIADVVVCDERTAILRVEEVVVVRGCPHVVGLRLRHGRLQQIEVAQHDGHGEHATAAVADEVRVTGIGITIVDVLGIAVYPLHLLHLFQVGTKLLGQHFGSNLGIVAAGEFVDVVGGKHRLGVEGHTVRTVGIEDLHVDPCTNGLHLSVLLDHVLAVGACGEARVAHGDVSVATIDDVIVVANLQVSTCTILVLLGGGAHTEAQNRSDGIADGTFFHQIAAALVEDDIALGHVLQRLENTPIGVEGVLGYGV